MSAPEVDGDQPAVTLLRLQSARRSNAWRRKKSNTATPTIPRTSQFFVDSPLPTPPSPVPVRSGTLLAVPPPGSESPRAVHDRKPNVLVTGVANGDGESESSDQSRSVSESGDLSRPGSGVLFVTSEEEEDEDSDEDSTSRKSSSLESTESMKRKKAFNVARELMTSEKVFVGVLKLLNEDFRNFVNGSVPEDVLSQIFDCLPNLQALNVVLLKNMEERIRKWDDFSQISDVIIKHGPFLKLYTAYISKFSSLTDALEEACKKYPSFADAVRRFEMSEKCQKLQVKHYMLKPVQRIPQYKLLLQEYRKHVDQDSPEYENTLIALDVVSKVAEHANRTIKEAEKFEKLLEIQNRLYGGYQVVKPGRIFIKEGELNKLCRKGMATRTFIMFNDSLLHCSTSQSLLRVHHDLQMSTIKIEVPCEEAYENEFSIISVTRSFTLSARSPEEKQEWLKALQAAIDDETERRKSFLQAKLHPQSATPESSNQDTLGKKAPVWIPDSRVTMCQLCAREFTITFRRHHCRACGKVVCYLCSAKRAPLRYQNYRAMRVCDKCFDVLQKEVEEMKLELVDTQECQQMQSSGSGGGTLRSPSLRSLKAQFRKFSAEESPEYLKSKPYVRQVLKEVVASDSESSARGYLYFRTKRGWKKKWFVIKDKVLYCYKASEDVVALTSTPLLSFDVITFARAQDGIDQRLYFELRHTGHPNMAFYAESIDAASRWQLAMKDATMLD